MHIYYDPDECERTSYYKPCTACDGDARKCNGACNGQSGFGQRRRAPEEVAKIKADKKAKHEEAVLAEAAAILEARGHKDRFDELMRRAVSQDNT